MAPLIGINRFAEITTPLGPDVLVLRRATIHEKLGALFQIDLNLLSENNAISFEDIVGKTVTIRLDVAVGGKRYFNGIVTSFAQTGSDTGFAEYLATVAPDFWILSRVSHCRIFQHKSIRDILLEILGDNHIEHELRLHGSFPQLDFCVQYRETDFNFCSRLMEQVGIYYFFSHEEGKNTLILADSQGSHEPFPDYERIDYRPYGEETIAGEFVRDWSTRKVLLTTQYAHKDFDFKKPKKDLLKQERTARYSASRDLEIYDYPGEYVEPALGEQLAKLRMEEIASRYETMNGLTDARGVAAGFRFTLGRSSGVTFPHEEHFREYLVISTTHSIIVPLLDGEENGGARPYHCSFSVIQQSDQFRPERVTPKPHVQGPQTAIVVGPAGEEIHTEKHGRVKIQFHWDRDGKYDENSSCWIRVSQPWAGKGWGSMSIPRIGQEVIVDFIEGNPDLPIITGRFYNGDCPPPYGTTSGLVSGLKSNTHKGKGYNEMSMDDTAGKEKITIHGQYDMNTTVEHDVTHTVVTGKFTEKIKSDTSITIETGKYEHDVATSTSKHHVKGAVTEIFEATQVTQVTSNISIYSGAEILIDAKDKITLHTGASWITMTSGGQITIKGKNIFIEGTEDIKESAPLIEISGGNEAKLGVSSQNIVCNKAKTAISGAAINSSAVGMHEVTGAVVKIN